MYSLLNKLRSKADDLSVSMLTVEQLVYVPSDPQELEKKRETEGFPKGCRAYATAFLNTFMTVIDKCFDDHKRAAKIVAALKKAQVETDHYIRKVKTLKEKNEKPDKIAGNEAKLQQAVSEEESLQAECITFLKAFLRTAPKEVFTANLELLFAQDEFSKTLNECAKFTLENPPEWIEEVCRHDANMTMKAQRASRRSSLPINPVLSAETGQSGGAQTQTAGTSGTPSVSDMQGELERLKLQNKKGASAYENLRAKAMEYKDEAETLRKKLAEMERTQSSRGSVPDFGFAAPPPMKQRPGTPGFAFDPSKQSLI